MPVPSGGRLYPLSPLQRGMLYDALFAPGAGVDIEQMVVELPEALDVPAFLGAWERVVERHDVLRTAFRWQDTDTPCQEVHPRVEIPVEEADWRGLGEREREERFGAFLREDRERGFDLSTAPLMRLALFRLGEAAYRLVWTFHHALLDGRAMTLVLRELFTLYEGLREGRDPALPQPRPYAEHVAWLARQDSAAARAFWSETLNGFTAPTPLPRRIAGEPEEEEPYAEREALFPEETAAALKEVARTHGLTLNTMVQGAWAVLLSRYAGEDDVVFGAVRACRHSSVEGADSMVGLFINTVPVRVRLRAEAPLLEVLRELRAQSLAVRPYEHAPLAEVQAWSEVTRGAPLFESVVNFQKEPFHAALRARGGAWAKRTFRIVRRPGIPLTVAVYGEPVLRAEIGYDTRAFDAELIARMLRHLGVLLEGIAAGPARRVAELPMLTPEERRQLLEGWGHSRCAYPAERTDRLFAAQAARTPHAVAVVCGAESLTYRELDRLASRLARRLRARGVEPGARVAVSLERSPEAVAAMLAVWKAGAVLVPLDPEHPEERRARLVEDAGAALVLTRDTLPADGEDPEEDAPLAAPGGPREPAYVIYTSGSTGTPKGVVVEHAALANTLRAGVEAFGFGEGDVFPVLSSPAFDISLFELWAPLLSGGTALLLPRERVRDVPALLDALRPATVLHAVPALMREIVRAAREGGGEPPARLRTVLVGGDTVAPELLDQLRDLWPAAGVHVLYGPTEAAILATAYTVPAGPVRGHPIGTPLPGVRLRVCDPHGGLAPVGVPGELFIGGAGVARGYLGRAELTAERFVAREAERLYRTGDRVRRRPDGVLEFLGRTDEQVKVRGHRIEPGEVQAALGRHPGVRECLVLAREDAAGEKRLVAYVVPGAAAPAPEELRSFLGTRLPEYMVPGAFVLLDAFPLGATGKVDRRALPAPEAGRRGEHVAPRNATEELLAQLWAEVLGVERVGAEDDFFALGGHSLRVTQVVSRVRALFGVELPLRALFEAPTVAELARRVEALRGAEDGVQLPPVLPVPRDRPLPLSFAQQRLWFIEQMGAVGAAYHVPTRLRLKGALHHEALLRALERIVARHEALRTTFAQADGLPVQRIVPVEEGGFHLLRHDLREHAEAEEELRRLIAAEAEALFDLEQGPLIRGRLVRMAEDDHVLLLSMHHIVSDGWSMGVFTRELSAGYAAFLRGEPDTLSPLPIQYADYAVWQRRWMGGELLREQAEYWKETLSGAPELLELPTDHPRPARQEYTGGSVGLVLDEELAAGLKALSQRHGTTLFMTLLAGWAVVLSRLSGQEDVVVGTPVAGRGRREMEGLIGFFVNTLALRVELSGGPTVAELLVRVRERALGAQQHQDIPFEQVVELVQPARSLAHTPLCQVMFAWQNAPGSRLELPGITLAPVPEEAQAMAKFDLSLALSEADGRIEGSVTYATALFERETVERYVGYLRRVLEAMAADEREHLDRLPLLGEVERRRVLEEWNATAAPLPEIPVHLLVSAQAARFPDAPALVHGAERVSYAELEARANRLAHHLRARGVGPEVRVGLLLERGSEAIVSLLAVLKAGGAYVPLDPEYPQERLAFMLRDSGARLLLTRSELLDRVPAEGVARVCLDDAREEIASQPAEAPRAELHPAHLAYVIYTSGSTGTPKGVLVPHGGLSNLIAFARERFGTGPGSRVLQAASPSFDASVLELFLALTSGAALVLAERSVLLSAEALSELLRRERVDTWAAVPALLDALPSADFPLLRTVTTGGDRCGGETAARWAPGRRFFNLYAPTEATIFATAHLADGSCAPPIGRPVANLRAYVLDPQGSPAPVGVPGEIHLGGAGVARGYHARPGLTAERFVPDPFSGEPGARLYRTGDTARWRSDGELEFLGRVDRQVKIRGYRIEPGEIEARLVEHEAVREAVVLAREDAPGERRLVAYHVGEAVAAEALRAHLSARLPEHMVPTAYVRLAALPLDANGKLDRGALPAPAGGTYGTREYEPPLGAVEETMAEIWTEVLGVERVGRHDRFFELGGHSLRATQVVARVREALGVELPLGALFEAQTLEEVAARVSALAPAGWEEAELAAALERLDGLSEEEILRLLDA